MGYCVSLNEVNFKFKIENADKIMYLLKELENKERLMWCDTKDIINCDNIFDLFNEFRYELQQNCEFLYIECFNGEKLGDEHKILDCISEFVEDKSYLEYNGEDGERFRFVINGNKCEYKKAKLVWE